MGYKNRLLLLMSIFSITQFLSQKISIAYADSVGNTKSSASIPEIGLWTTKKEDGVFSIYQCGKALCGRFVGMQYDTVLPPKTTEGNSQCNFLMLTNFVQNPYTKEWKGNIADPRNEKVYAAKIWSTSFDELHIRGYIGISLFGETEIWHRFKGKISNDCHIYLLK